MTQRRTSRAHLSPAAIDLLLALKVMIHGKVRETVNAVHPSGRFCDVCGRNSEEFVHSDKCPVLMAEKAIARAEATA